MITPIPEFVDTYSDDMIFLQTVRRSLLRHPLEQHVPQILDATLARLYIVMLVGNVENALNEESKRTDDPLLGTYLTSSAPNTEKVQALHAYLQQGLGPDAVDPEVLSDYLAIKYLRNGIIHADRRTGSQAQYVVDRGFPLDSRSLELAHLHRLAEVDSAIIMYLGVAQLLGGREFSAPDPGTMMTPGSMIATDAEVHVPFTEGDFVATHKRNLSLVSQSWKQLAQDHLDVASDQPLLDLIGALRPSDGDTATAVRAWARSALYSWGEIVRLWPVNEARKLADDSSYRESLLQVSRAVAASGAYPAAQLPAQAYRGLWEHSAPEGALADGQLATLFQGDGEIEPRELLEFYAIGDIAYNLTARIPLAWIWPIVAGGEPSQATETALAFVDLWELSRRWYSAIEYRDEFDAEVLRDVRGIIAAAHDRASAPR